MREFQSTSARRIDEQHPMFKLYQKAKKYGQWDPLELDFSKDIEDFRNLAQTEKEMLLRLVSMFIAGEEAVTADIAPLIIAMQKVGTVEDEMYLTTFIFEEAKHVEFFARWLQEVGVTEDLAKYHLSNYRQIFYEDLPNDMSRLLHDQSPEAIAKAVTTYNMIVENMLAETGYTAFYGALESKGLMPGLLQGISYVKRDESRHIGFGTFLLQRLVAQDARIFDVITNRMDELLTPAIGVVAEIFVGDERPFGLEPKHFQDFAIQRFNNRINVIERAKAQSEEDVLAHANELLEV